MHMVQTFRLAYVWSVVNTSWMIENLEFTSTYLPEFFSQYGLQRCLVHRVAAVRVFRRKAQVPGYGGFDLDPTRSWISGDPCRQWQWLETTEGTLAGLVFNCTLCLDRRAGNGEENTRY